MGLLGQIGEALAARDTSLLLVAKYIRDAYPPMGAHAIVRAAAHLNALRNEFDWLDDGRTVLQRDPGRDQATWWTFAGGRANAQLAVGLAAANVDVGAVDDLFIRVRDVRAVEAFKEALETHCSPPPEPNVPEPQVDELKFIDCLPREMAVAMLSARQRDDQTVLDVLAEPLVSVR